MGEGRFIYGGRRQLGRGARPRTRRGAGRTRTLTTRGRGWGPLRTRLSLAGRPTSDLTLVSRFSYSLDGGAFLMYFHIFLFSYFLRCVSSSCCPLSLFLLGGVVFVLSSVPFSVSFCCVCFPPLPPKKKSVLGGCVPYVD